MSQAIQTNVPIKEEEIRPDDLFSAFQDLSAKDAQNFFDRSQFVSVSCPACGQEKTANGFKKFSFEYGQCTDCGTLYVTSRPNRGELLRYYGQAESQKFWVETILKKTGEKRQQSILLPNLARIQGLLKERNKSPARVLDVGAANGAFLTEWRKNNPSAEIIAIEPGEKAAAQCREKGMKVFEDFVENAAGQPGAQGDLVTCFEVMEHVQDPLQFAKALCGVTAPGGVSVITCLGADGFDIQLLWEKSRSVMPPYHLNFLSKKGMETLFSKAGFDEIEILTPGRLDVDIVKKSLEREQGVELSRFEKLLLSRGPETHVEFQKFLASHALSSHVWILAHRR